MSRTTPIEPIGVAPAEAMGYRTARGVAWMLGQTLANKVIGTVGQFLLLAILLPEDFGVVMVAYAMSIVPVLIQQGGVRQVLVQRSQHFSRWANPAFWLSMTLGLIAAALMVALIPLATLMYTEPQLPWLMLLVAALFPLDALTIVPMARMQSELRFRLVAAIAFVQNSGQIALQVALALMDWGPYSLVAARIFVLLGVAVMVWTTAPVRVHRRPQFHRFGHLLADGWMVVAVNGSNLAYTYVPYLVLGKNTKITGYYNTAFNLSLQAMVLFTESLGSVLLPVLSKLKNEPQRQAEGFLRAAKLMASLGIFACLLQVPTAGPLLHALFGDKWNASIGIIQVLSIGMAFKTIGAPANSLLYAQGRFKTEAIFSITSAIAFIGMTAIGAWRGEAMGVAVAAMIHMVITEPLHLYLAVHPTGYGWPVVFRTFALPLGLSVASIGTAIVVASFIPEMPSRDWIVLATLVVVSAGLYFPLLRVCLPSVWRDGRDRLLAVLGR